MTSPTYSMGPLEQPLLKQEQDQIASYHDMTAQPRPSSAPTHSPIPFSLPYSHYAIIYIDHQGELQAETSASIAGCEKSIFTEDVQNRFLKVASGDWQSSSQSASQGACDRLNVISSHLQPRYNEPVPFEWHTSLNKRSRPAFRHSPGSGYARELPPGFRYASLKRSTLQLGQTNIIRMYYEKALDCFQQLNCRVIAKAFVKEVEPRKQVNHPYNGRKTIDGATKVFDPEKTKPKWWPAGVRHKEPDHLGKAERIRLIVHILCELKNSHGITAERLMKAGQDVKRAIEPKVKLDILDEIYYVRGMEELYLDGKISGDTTIQVSEVNIDDEIQGQMMSERINSMRVTRATAQRSDSLPVAPEIPYCLPMQKNKRPAEVSDYYMSPSASPSVGSRKSSLERGVPAYSSEVDQVVLTRTDSRGSNNPGTLTPASTTASSVPEYFAAQFAPQPAGHTTQPGFWDTLPAVTPHFPYPEY
ncbi:hypothetical protein BJY04DRAFT_216876 [Aspergillus karnatakaensis]|uniref:DUF2841 domain-containing protein n=1 Tax=Aspergillus karnatakaensis TaxID=1810916 RepID=UPI003CCE3147